MTQDDALSCLFAARNACQALDMHEAHHWAVVATDSVWNGLPAERQALALTFEFRASDVERLAALKANAEWRAWLEADARVLGFCAAVLRATVEENGEKKTLVTESDELRFLRAELAAARASVRALETTAFLRERERDEARHVAEGRKRDLHEASRQVEDHARREVAAESRAKAAEVENARLREALEDVNARLVERDGMLERAIGQAERFEAEAKLLRAGAWLPTVDDVVHSWDDRTTIAEVLAVVRTRLSEGGRS